MTYVTDVHPSPRGRQHAFRHAQRFPARQFQALRDESADLGRTWTAISGRSAGRRPGLDHRAGPHRSQPAVRGHGVRPVVHRGWRPALDQDSQRHAPIPIRDLEIQKRESDLAAASFGRSFFILDDYSALRQITPQVCIGGRAVRPAAAGRGRIDELGYYRAQGDNMARRIRPFGAILSTICATTARGGSGADAPKVVLQIADSTGKMVRQLDASSKAGLHRTPWDLRETAPGRGRACGRGGGGGGGRGAGDAAATPPTEPPNEETTPPAGGGGRGGGGRGGFGGRGGRGGPPARPGTYTVRCLQTRRGAFTPLGKPQTVE